MKRPALFMLLLFAVVFICGWGELPPEEGGVVFSDQHPFSLRVATDKNEYRLGEPVKIMAYLTNLNSREVESYFSSGRIYDFMICDEMGTEVWQMNHGRAFTQALVPFTVGAHATREFSAVWEQIDNEGNRVWSGRYVIKAVIDLIPKMENSRRSIFLK
jgi:hypothetical protein